MRGDCFDEILIEDYTSHDFVRFHRMYMRVGYYIVSVYETIG